MNHKYARLLGYTQEEMEKYFDNYFPKAMETQNMDRQELLNQLKFWYNGYSWDGKTKVYNPFSIINFFDQGEFKNFWFSTGTPSF